MKGLKLKLGRFDQCVEYLSHGQSPCYSIDGDRKIFYYMSCDGTIAFTTMELTSDSSITIPTFDVGHAISRVACICSERTVDSILSGIELQIFAMIERIIKENGDDLRLENIIIPVRNVVVFNNGGHDGCYGWAELGIAVIA